MPAVKLTNFQGIAPRISPELLPDNAAQIAYNTKLNSGDIIPYREATRYADTHRQTEVKKIYGLRGPDGNPVFLSWTTDVDVVMADSDIEDEQRFYYTGDGVPKVSTYKLATSGQPPYPVDYYELGLPLPVTRPTITGVGRPSVGVTKIVRDSASVATVTTSSPHGFRTGVVISITGCPSSTSSTATFNVTNGKCTVLNDTQFTYFSPGEEATINNTGTASLAGNLFVRSCVYTWYTPWGEESIPSDPSNQIYVREGQDVVLSDLPQEPPEGKNYIRGIKVYRSINSSAKAMYAYLTTLWYPAKVASYYRKDNLLYVTMVDPHYVIAGDLFAITVEDGSPDATLAVRGGTVKTIENKYTFVVESTGADFDPVTAQETTLFYHDCSPLEQDTPYYWGLDGWGFTDTYDSSTLINKLDSENNEAPPKDLQGLMVFTQGIYCGFRRNQIFFSEQDKPYAWPAEYAITLDANIVALCACGIYLVALTDDNPYVISGSNPKNLSYNKVDFPYACLSKRSVVQMGYGLAYATHGGIALYNPSQGMTKATEYIYDYDTWGKAVDPSTISATFYQDKYIAAHAHGGFCFDRDPDTTASRASGSKSLGGAMVSLGIMMTASWVDQVTGFLYYVSDKSGYIQRWDDENSPSMMTEWKSKVVISKDYMNLGAARVIADYDNDENYQAVVYWNQQVSSYNAIYWAGRVDLAEVNGPKEYRGEDYMRKNTFGTFNAYPINGDNVTIFKRRETNIYPVVFRLWRNKKLIFQRTVGNNEIFRLPTGYRTDTIEFAVNSDTRIRAIHLGETPYGLRQA